MYRIGFLLISSILLLVSQSVAIESEHLDISGVIKSRKVIGVVYFKKNSVKLSKAQQAEIDRISSLVVSCSSDKVVRVEGFSTKSDRNDGLLDASLLRAKSVWHYLRKIDPLYSRNLYLTGFCAQQSISNLQGERVEIAIYENPFNEKMDSYSSN